MRSALRTVLRASLQGLHRPLQLAPSAGLRRPLSERVGAPLRHTASRAAPSTTNHMLLITLTGDDRPGITHNFSQILHESKCTLLDANQATIHGKLCLYFLLNVTEADQTPLLSELLWKSKEFPGLNINFEVLDGMALEEDSKEERAAQEHVVTLIGRELSFGSLSAVTAKIAEYGFNIVTINQLSNISPRGLAWREVDTQGQGKIPREQAGSLRETLSGEIGKDGVLDKTEWDAWATANPKDTIAHSKDVTRALEMRIRPADATAAAPEGASSIATALQDQLLNMQQDLGCDIALQREATLRRVKRLVVMDMDSTLIQQEVLTCLTFTRTALRRMARVSAEQLLCVGDRRDSPGTWRV